MFRNILSTTLKLMEVLYDNNFRLCSLFINFHIRFYLPLEEDGAVIQTNEYRLYHMGKWIVWKMRHIKRIIVLSTVVTWTLLCAKLQVYYDVIFPPGQDEPTQFPVICEIALYRTPFNKGLLWIFKNIFKRFVSICNKLYKWNRQ